MKKVLVLEDESSIRSFIVINLRRAGYQVVEAESGFDLVDAMFGRSPEPPEYTLPPEAEYYRYNP